MKGRAFCGLRLDALNATDNHDTQNGDYDWVKNAIKSCTIFSKNPCSLRDLVRSVRSFCACDEDGQGKAWPCGPLMWLASLRVSMNGQTPPASHFGQNVNYINDPSAIRTSLGQERAGKRDRVPGSGVAGHLEQP